MHESRQSETGVVLEVLEEEKAAPEGGVELSAWLWLFQIPSLSHTLSRAR